MSRQDRRDTLLAVTILSTAMGLVELCLGAGTWFAFRDQQWALFIAAGVMLIGTLLGTVVLILAAVRALQDEPEIEDVEGAHDVETCGCDFCTEVRAFDEEPS